MEGEYTGHVKDGKLNGVGVCVSDPFGDAAHLRVRARVGSIVGE